MSEQPPGFPPPGSYAVDDPYEPWRTSYWTVGGEGLKPWPYGAKYGPLRPAKALPGTSVELHRGEVRLWRARCGEYRGQVLLAIAKDPAGAVARFAAETERCPQCRGFFSTVGRERSDEQALTGEQRRQMIADLRRAGHPEKLIAQALHMSPTTVNREARRAGVGAPLKKQRVHQTGDAVIVDGDAA